MAQKFVPGRFLDAGEEPSQTLAPIEGYEKFPLVSLKEAIQPIKSLLHNADSMVETAKRNSRKPADNLTSDESAAIHLYTMQWPEPHPSLYTLLNKRLRSQDRNTLISWFLFLKLFFTALYKLPSFKGTIWRGVRGNLTDQYDEDQIWWGASSCTETMKIMQRFVGLKDARTLFNIECINGKVIKAHSYFTEENEILLMPGTYFKVVDKWSPAEDLYMIQLRETKTPYETIAPPFDLPAPFDSILSLTDVTISSQQKSVSIGANTSPPCQFRADKFWLDLQYHDKEHQSIKKPNEMEKEMDEPPLSIKGSILDRIQGSMIGMALGDALGAPVKRRSRQYLVQNPVTDLSSGGTLGLVKGQFTDDTSMALCLANSLVARRNFVPYDQLVRYKWWYKHGYMSSTGHCFDMGAATRQSVLEFERRQKLFAKEHKIPFKDMDNLSDPKFIEEFNAYCSEDEVAGSGALSRLAPVPLFFYQIPTVAIEFSGCSGRITHGDVKARDACRYYGALIAAACHNYTKEQLLDKEFYLKHRNLFGGDDLHPDVESIARGSYQKDGYDAGIRGKGYIVNALEAALWAFWSDRDSFETGALKAVNLGDDTNTTAAIYGQLAGAYYGYQKLPEHWLKHVYAKTFMKKLSKWIAYEGECWYKRQ